MTLSERELRDEISRISEIGSHNSVGYFYIKDKADLESLIVDYEYRSFYPIEIEKFSKEIEKRVKSLINRNSIVLAKEERLVSEILIS